jgi:hypothetical protein
MGLADVEPGAGLPAEDVHDGAVGDPAVAVDPGETVDESARRFWCKVA